MSKELKPIDFSEYSSDSDDSVIDVDKPKKITLSQIKKKLNDDDYDKMNKVFNKVLEDKIITMSPAEKANYIYRQLPVNYYHKKMEWLLMEEVYSTSKIVKQISKDMKLLQEIKPEYLERYERIQKNIDYEFEYQLQADMNKALQKEHAKEFMDYEEYFQDIMRFNYNKNKELSKKIKELEEGIAIDEMGCKASELNLNITCKIYVIEDKDGKKYVGQTTQPIICRYIQHLKTSDCNSRLLDLENSIIKCIDVCDPKDRYKVEKKWIEKIDCVNKNGNKINKEIMELNDTGDDEIHGF